MVMSSVRTVGVSPVTRDRSRAGRPAGRQHQGGVDARPEHQELGRRPARAAGSSFIAAPLAMACASREANAMIVRAGFALPWVGQTDPSDT
jgi:hypothetical protein